MDREGRDGDERLVLLALVPFLGILLRRLVDGCDACLQCWMSDFCFLGFEFVGY